MKFVTLSTLFTSLLLFAQGITQEDKTAFCDRASSAKEDQPVIVAASKTDYHGKFYIFEANKTWLYDAESEKVEEFFDLVDGMKLKAPGFEHKPIVRATAIRSCPNAGAMSFSSRQFITEEKSYPYEDIANSDTWGVEDANERNKELYEKYKLDINDKILTVGTSCYFDGKVEMNYVYLFAPPNKYRACSTVYGENREVQSEECKAPNTAGIYRPFGFKDDLFIKETTKIPNALAYDFGPGRTDQKALVVIGDEVNYWTATDQEDKGQIRRTTVNEIFGCKSGNIVVILFIIGSLIVLALVISGVVVVIVVLKSRSNFDEGETVTVVAPPKVLKGKKK